MLFSQMLLIFLSTAHIKTLVCGKELGHGADGNSIGAVLLQRLRCFTYQKARRNQLGGHFCQFELKKLPYEKRGGGVNNSGRTSILFHWVFTKYTENRGNLLTWLFESVSPNCLRTNRWSLASCTEACAAPREQEAGGRVFRGKPVSKLFGFVLNAFMSIPNTVWPQILTVWAELLLSKPLLLVITKGMLIYKSVLIQIYWNHSSCLNQPKVSLKARCTQFMHKSVSPEARWSPIMMLITYCYF